MNGYQVQDAWKKYETARQQAATDPARMRAATAWVLTTFPQLCEDNYPDPTLLLAALTLKAEAPNEPVTKAQAVSWAKAYHAGLHDRGWRSNTDLAEELARLEAA